MNSFHEGKDFWEGKFLFTLSLVFILLGGWAGVAGKDAQAQEKILTRGVPYFHQRWHFD
jgi:hypothetical protein